MDNLTKGMKDDSQMATESVIFVDKNNDTSLNENPSKLSGQRATNAGQQVKNTGTAGFVKVTEGVKPMMTRFMDTHQSICKYDKFLEVQAPNLTLR